MNIGISYMDIDTDKYEWINDKYISVYLITNIVGPLGTKLWYCQVLLTLIQVNFI